MCGICGFVETGLTADEGHARLRAMSDTLAHRGPDDAGVWFDPASGVGLANRRLAIVDLSPDGHQPMNSPRGRYWIAFNGEVYNHRELRAELENPLAGAVAGLRGRSDTEVLLAAFERWGIEGALTRAVGMFALALWDRHERRLTLARDRLGEKPLYYGWSDGVFLFGSELKALRAHPRFRSEIDRESLAQYLRYSAVPAPRSIYRGIAKLLPGTLLRLDEGTIASRAQPQPEAYWSLARVAEDGVSDPFRGSDDEARAELERLLGQAVEQQMLADVPLGALLSGGIDSSTVVALMQARSIEPVRTFTIGFAERAYDEADAAHAVARHLGTNHEALEVTPAEAMAVVPRLPRVYDEPFADSSQLPTLLVCALVRRHVTVGLSGDGGDELFGGYNRHLWARRIWERVRPLPAPARAWAARAITAASPTRWDRWYEAGKPLLPATLHQRMVGEKMHKLARLLSADSRSALYEALVANWGRDESPLLGHRAGRSPSTAPFDGPALPGLASEVMYLDAKHYLSDDVLTKVDRASMAVGLEVRAPFLDHRVVEFAWRLPLGMKLRGGRGKWLTRQVLQQYVPKGLVERPKMGFGVPLDAWLRGPLREWAEGLLGEDRLRRDGFFDPQTVRRKWDEHQAGTRLWHHQIWAILMFQVWLEAESERSA